MSIRLYLECTPGVISQVDVSDGETIEASRNRLIVRDADLCIVGIFPLPEFVASEVNAD